MSTDEPQGLPAPDPYAGLPVLPAFGDAPEVVPAQQYAVLPYFGERIRVISDASLAEIELVQFMDAATTLDEEDLRAITLLLGFLRNLVHPDDWDRFWATVRKYRQGAKEQMAFAKYVIESMTGHPFEEQSDSSSTQSSTEQNSGVVSSLSERRRESVSERVQRRLESEGRPDLAVAVLQARRGGVGA